MQKGKTKLKYDEVRDLLSLPNPEFPKYASQLINLANIYSQATRPKNVGQMSELMKEFKANGGKTFEDWKKWYLSKYPNAIDEATKKIMEKINDFKKVLNELDEKTIRKWVEDLILVKTFMGLNLQEAILKKVAEEMGKSYRLSTPDEESKGIDGYIGDIPVSIKPSSYLQEKHLKEELKGKIIIYQKKKNEIEIDYSDLLR
ncbi:Type-2 restriction enzyme MjaI [Methanocaldococcus lauensis]|uniref:Type-2 restriction enzyme MjaI n=1 Tax=Methanocaldococcus lauensis TaxID=2546128 RepID=A0A8D6SW54_9EURY|nr:MjaI family restriction endonuclease [Methanocaldococcus lauensis]CAB3287312.1 Type-2 restriction enzyme MjaI [Methanocaldococcus lauensis]